MTNVKRVSWKTQPPQAIESLLAAFESDSRTLAAFAAARQINAAGFRAATEALFPERMRAAMAAKVRKSTPYQRGRAFEYRVAAFLQKAGFMVTRSAGSRGAADLVVIGRGRVLLVQAKCNGNMPPKERKELTTLACTNGALPIMAERSDGRTLRFWIVSEDTERKEFRIHAQPC